VSDEIVFPETGLTARDELRTSEFGLLRCPSCGELAAEILGQGHSLLIMPESEKLPGDGSAGWLVVECRDGERVTVTDFAQGIAAANIALADDMWFRETPGPFHV
jgi:hypothetical protein